MILEYLCAPALLFVAFSLTQIIIDIFRTAYETALVKVAVMVVFTLLLNALCSQGLSIVSWMIVFIPFIMMTLITALILVMLGMSPNVDVRDPPEHRHGIRMNVYKEPKSRGFYPHWKRERHGHGARSRHHRGHVHRHKRLERHRRHAGHHGHHGHAGRRRQHHA